MSADELDLAAIRQRAEAATPGPWRTWNDGHVGSPSAHIGGIVMPTEGSDPEQRMADAEHIAGMDPATTLALVQRVEDAEAEVARLRASAVALASRYMQQRDDARARLAAVAGALPRCEQYVGRHDCGSVRREGLSPYYGAEGDCLPCKVRAALGSDPAEVVAACNICGTDDPSDCERHGLCCDDCRDALSAEVVAGIKAEREYRVQHPHPGHVETFGESWTECESEKQARNYARSGYVIESRVVGPWERAEVVAGDVDPLCRERNPGLDEWHGNCCRFPKSCSPYIRAEVVAGGDES